MSQLNRRTLTDAERLLKEQCEETIRAGLTSFMEVGQALTTMRDGKLYRELYATFEDYCASEYGISRTRGYELMNAAAVVSAIADSGMPEPANEAQARALSRLPEEQRGEVWQKALDQTNGKPTAAAINAAAGRDKTSPGSATPVDGAEGAASSSGQAVPSDSPKDSPTGESPQSEEDHPSTAGSGETDGGATPSGEGPSEAAPRADDEAAEQEESAEGRPSDVAERQQERAEVSAPAAAPDLVKTPIGPMTRGFAEALDRLVPDPNPHREWQSQFLKDVFAAAKAFRKYGGEEIAEKADEQLLEEFASLVADLDELQTAIAKAQLAASRTNVVQLRSVQ